MTQCKVCGHKAIHYVNLDIMLGGNNNPFTNAGVMVEYVRCTYCGFIFCPELCSWTKQQFLDNIYNDGYVRVDPDYISARSGMIAHWYKGAYPDKSKTMLDYGAGNCGFAKNLNSVGYNCESWDTMWGTPAPNKQYDIVTCFEVFEHVPDPIETLKEIMQFVAPGGKLVFSTLMNNGMIVNRPETGFWYMVPRNGHICMHSYESLNYLAKSLDLQCTHLNNSMHEICH